MSGGSNNDGTLSFGNLRRTNVSRCESVFHSLNRWTPTDWATAVGGEVGEALNKVKKLRRLDDADQGIDTPMRREALANDIVEELADVVIYADLLAARLGRDLGRAVIEKFNRVSEERGAEERL